jgi:hypothetical protein
MGFLGRYCAAGGGAVIDVDGGGRGRVVGWCGGVVVWWCGGVVVWWTMAMGGRTRLVAR